MTSVLIVEDEPAGAAAYLDWVACLPGFAVIGQTGSGAKALQWLEQNPVDLVLLDVDLPDMSGLNVLRIMRGRGYTMDVIAEMRGDRPAVLQASLCYGVLYCLIKPTTFTMIQQGLKRYAAYRSRLARCGEFVVQAEVDDLMASLRERDQARRLPKGICPESLNPIVAELRAADRGIGFSAAQVAGIVGASRVTARRYLEYLADTGPVRRNMRYGAGRPAVEYRWLAWRRDTAVSVDLPPTAQSAS